MRAIITTTPIRKYTSISALITGLLLSGCASDDSYNTADQQQPPQGMGRGMGMGGPGGGKNRQRPPMEDNSSRKEPDLPDEAFTACGEKQAGDAITFSLPDGTLVEATCKVIDDHLVAVPNQEPDNPPRR